MGEKLIVGVTENIKNQCLCDMSSFYVSNPADDYFQYN